MKNFNLFINNVAIHVTTEFVDDYKVVLCKYKNGWKTYRFGPYYFALNATKCEMYLDLKDTLAEELSFISEKI